MKTIGGITFYTVAELQEKHKGEIGTVVFGNPNVKIIKSWEETTEINGPFFPDMKAHKNFVKNILSVQQT